jgi:predicted DNA-binding WGR domain protein
MPSYDEIVRITLERLRPKILEQMAESSGPMMLYLDKKGLGHAVKHFENTKGGNSKWWKVFPPYLIKTGMWGIRVEFGKIGKSGQTRVHAEATEDTAWRYYHEKMSEKKRKGYILKASTNESAKLKAIQAAAKRKLNKKVECTHATLVIAGKNKWKCGSCSTVIEFGKSLETQSREEVNEAVRYINLGGLDD